MKHRNFEPLLEKIITVYEKTNGTKISNRDDPNFNKYFSELHLMQALGYVKINYSDMNMESIAYIELLSPGIAHFYLKSQTAKDKVLNFLFGLVSGVVVGYATALLLHILGLQ